MWHAWLCVLVWAHVVTFFGFPSLICEELDRPRTEEEDEKSEENEKDAAEKRKIRGEILKSEF